MSQEIKSPKPRRRRVWPWIVGIVSMVIVLGSAGSCVMLGIAANLASGNRQPTWRFGDAVGVIYIEGPIGVSGATSGTGVNSSTIIDFVKQPPLKPTPTPSFTPELTSTLSITLTPSVTTAAEDVAAPVPSPSNTLSP